MKIIFCVIFFSITTQALGEEKKPVKGNPNFFSRMVPYLDSRASQALNHSIVKGFRSRSDCLPDCPGVDVWQYEYLDGEDRIKSNAPIASLKKHWKHPDEARIIALSLFGTKQKYLDGILDFLASSQRLKSVNNFEPESKGGYDTFTFRIYVAKRNPASKIKGKLGNATSKKFIKKLLKMGCEIAYVDNRLKTVALDGTFWRFMVAAEKMPPKQRIRYLLRDVDWKLTATEAYAVGRWIQSESQFHRFHPFPICTGPLTAGLWGGTHIGDPVINDMKTRIEYFPYRLLYGDDELFLRDMVFPILKNTGSVLTHHYKKNLMTYIANPYKDSCETPTQQFCKYLNEDSECNDEIIPSKLKFPIMEISHDTRLDDIEDRYFAFPAGVEKIDSALEYLSTK
ncbi:MAG: hypothetical protein AB8G05_26275 [Oligoflexales bacterium]